MKTVYQLIIKERDDYFYYHNTLICKILTIDASDTKTTEHITVVNGTEARRTKLTETMVNGKYTSVPDSDEIFDSLESLKEHLEKEYKLVYTDKYRHFFLDTEEMDTVFTITNIKGQTGIGICSDHINLQDLLGLDATGQKEQTLEKELRQVNNNLFFKYKKILEDFNSCSPKDVYDLCEKATTNSDKLTLDKHSRWLGYVQGRLISENTISVKEERYYVRPIYQEVYKKYGIEQETL